MPNTVRPLIVKCGVAALAFWAAAGYGAPAAKPGGAAPNTPPAGSAPAGAVSAGAVPAGAVPSGAVPASAAPAPTAPAPATAQPAVPMTGPQVIQFLDQTIDWYRTLGIQQQTANEPSDLLILNDNRQTASRVMALAIEVARADADLLAQQPPAAGGTVPDSSSQPLSQLQSKFNAQGIAAQAELAADQRQLASARGNAAVELKAKISELQGELDLLDTRKKLLSTLLTISSESDANGFSATSLKAQIDAMAITAPPAANAAAPSPATAAPAASGTQSANNASTALTPLATSGGNVTARFGIWDLAADVFRLSEKVSTIDGLDRRTAALQDAFAKIRSPLVDQLRGLSSRGDALATQADTADAATLTQMRTQLDALADQIKQESALLIPLGKAGVLLAQYRRNLANWRGLIEKQYDNALKALGVRLLILTALLTVVFVAAGLWRRAVMRYVRDSRRRYQLLLLRKIALWTLTVLIVGFAFASELGSVVTFAGLITAGLAVAMQSVLVSIVGYFFLIGKYGIRIGDHVQFGDVTGEVIELGLVRMHLMELGGHGQLGPTGRVVAFANSIVFQVSSGLFKQIPGVNFAWHEIALSLPAGIDYVTAKNKLLTAVNAALKDSHDEIVRQTEEIQRTTATAGADLQARVQLNFTATGIEARIRYPVHLSDAAAIDDRVSQELIPVVAELAAQPSSPHPSPTPESSPTSKP
jgi:small-conductance mechanosensitive channel